MASSQSLEFLGKTALVTGSNSGIGKAIALTLARRGANVTLCGRDLDRLETALRECVQASGGHDDRFLSMAGDVTEASHRQDLVDHTVAKFGQLDILVCNAGIFDQKIAIGNATEESFDQTMNVCVKSVFFFIQTALPYLAKSKGNIISISSMASDIPIPGTVVYCAAKAALDHMTRCLAMGFASKGVRVNTVNPSYILTGLHRQETQKERDEAHLMFHNSELNNKPLENRLVTLEDIAEGVVFLASDKAKYITGHHLAVNGGRVHLGMSAATHPFLYQ